MTAAPALTPSAVTRAPAQQVPGGFPRPGSRTLSLVQVVALADGGTGADTLLVTTVAQALADGGAGIDTFGGILQKQLVDGGTGVDTATGSPPMVFLTGTGVFTASREELATPSTRWFTPTGPAARLSLPSPSTEPAGSNYTWYIAVGGTPAEEDRMLETYVAKEPAVVKYTVVREGSRCLTRREPPDAPDK